MLRSIAVICSVQIFLISYNDIEFFYCKVFYTAVLHHFDRDIIVFTRSVCDLTDQIFTDLKEIWGKVQFFSIIVRIKKTRKVIFWQKIRSGSHQCEKMNLDSDHNDLDPDQSYDVCQHPYWPHTQLSFPPTTSTNFSRKFLVFIGNSMVLQGNLSLCPKLISTGAKDFP